MQNHPRRIGRIPKCPMSAYSASPPVTARNTAPITMKPFQPLTAKNCTAAQGFSAFRMCGALLIPLIPKAAMMANHTSMIGPKTFPILPVP